MWFAAQLEEQCSLKMGELCITLLTWCPPCWHVAPCPQCVQPQEGLLSLICPIQSPTTLSHHWRGCGWCLLRRGGSQVWAAGRSWDKWSGRCFRTGTASLPAWAQLCSELSLPCACWGCSEIVWEDTVLWWGTGTGMDNWGCCPLRCPHLWTSPELCTKGCFYPKMLALNNQLRGWWIAREYQAAKSALFLTQQVFFSLKWLFFFFGLKVEEETAEAAETDAEGMVI